MLWAIIKSNIFHQLCVYCKNPICNALRKDNKKYSEIYIKWHFCDDDAQIYTFWLTMRCAFKSHLTIDFLLVTHRHIVRMWEQKLKAIFLLHNVISSHLYLTSYCCLLLNALLSEQNIYELKIKSKLHCREINWCSFSYHHHYKM